MGQTNIKPQCLHIENKFSYCTNPIRVIQLFRFFSVHVIYKDCYNIFQMIKDFLTNDLYEQLLYYSCNFFNSQENDATF